MRTLFIFFLGTILLSSCSSSTKIPKSSQLIESGIASWYGPGFQGKQTANGEVFNTSGFTAAHRTLPFNTRVLVVNTQNNKSLIVRINDRGPYAKDRIIDLSKGAAKRLDIIEKGTAPVKLYLVDQSPNSIKVDNLKQPTYTVQIASYSDAVKAHAKASEFNDGWAKQVVVDRQKVYRVFVGKFSNVDQAKARKAQLAKQGVDGFVKQVEN
jgi:rare lipoprotein A